MWSAEIKVQWDPLPQEYVNGRLLGYRIYYYEHSSYLTKTVNTSSPDVNMVTLRGLLSVQRYTCSGVYFKRYWSTVVSDLHYHRWGWLTVQQLSLIFETIKAGIARMVVCDYNHSFTMLISDIVSIVVLYQYLIVHMLMQRQSSLNGVTRNLTIRLSGGVRHVQSKTTKEKEKPNTCLPRWEDLWTYSFYLLQLNLWNLLKSVCFRQLLLTHKSNLRMLYSIHLQACRLI